MTSLWPSLHLKKQSKAFKLSRDRTDLYESEGWEQIDLRINQPFALDNSKEITIYGGLDNITDNIRDFASPFDNKPDVGRVIYLGLSYDF